MSVTIPVRSWYDDTNDKYYVDGRPIFDGTGEIGLDQLADYARGSVIRGGAADWEAYAAKASGNILVGDGTDINTVAVSGDATLSAAGALTVTKTSDAQTNVSTIIAGNANGAIRVAHIGIGAAVSGVAGTVTLPDAGYIGNSGGATLTFDSSGATDYAHFGGCRLGVNEATPGGQWHVVCSGAAVVGQIIEAAAAQTANLFEVNSNGGSGGNLVVINSVGNIGQGVSANSEMAFYSYLIENDPDGDRYGFNRRTALYFTSPNIESIRGFSTDMYLIPDSGVTLSAANRYVGFNGNVRNTGAGTVSYMYQYRAAGYIANGVIESHRAYHVSNPTVASGRIDRAYGLFIDNLTAGTTDNYPIYSLGGRSYHAGDWVFGANVKVGGSEGDNPATRLEVEQAATLTANLADGYAAALTLDPGYTGAYTVTRHNYIDVNRPSTASGAAITDAAVFRFDAAIGTHEALAAAFDTTDSNSDTTAWAGGIIVNVNGTLYKVPLIAV